MPMLSVQDALGDRLVALEKLPFTMGRRATNELRLGSPEVSGEHAEIVLDGVTYRLRDKHSRFGTFVNGEAVTDRELRSGDRIRLGLRGGANLVFGDGSVRFIAQSIEPRTYAAVVTAVAGDLPGPIE